MTSNENDGLTPDDGSDGDGTDLKDDVEVALRRVRDPEMDVDVFEAGLVENIRIHEGNVTVEADLSDFRPQEGEQVMASLMHAASSVDGVDRAHVERATPGVDDADRSTGVHDVDRVIAVASAKGGVGKTTVATGLASALSADRDVGLFDADIHGPNVPEILEVSGPVHSDEEGNPLPVSSRGLEVMSVGLMESGAPLAWRGAMAHDALTELFEDTAWNDRDTLVIDLPPGTGDVVLTTLQEVPVDGVVFVTTPFHASVTDTDRSIALFRENDVPVLGVVVNMGTYTCDSCGDEHSMFPGESPLDDLDAPVLAELPFSAEFQGAPTPGDPNDAMAALAADVEDRLEEIWDVAVPEGAVDLRGVPAEERRERVREAFLDVDPGEEFAVVSDRDPTPVYDFLADLVNADDDDPFEEFAVRQQNPETWHLRTVRP